MGAVLSAAVRRLRLKNIHRVLILCALNTAVALLCTCVFSPTPENNDDYIVHTVLGGAFGEPSPYIGIVNILFARLICALQNAAPALNWFSVCLYTLLGVSLSAVGASFWLARPDAVGGLISAAFCVFVGAPLYLSLQYTKYAIFIAAAGCVTLLFGARRGRPRPWAVWTGALLCVLASMVRPEAFAAGAAVCVPAVLFELFKTDLRGGIKRWLGKNAKTLIAFAAVLAAVLALYGVHRAVYAAVPEAENYRIYLAAQQRATDYDLVSYNDRYDDYDAIGISENDLRMIAEWSFADSGKFTAETLDAVATAGKPDKSPIWQRFVQGIRLFTVTKSSTWFCLVMWAAAMLLGDRRTRIQASCAALTYFALLFVLAASGRVTRWVCMGLMAACCITTAWSLVSGHIKAEKRYALALCGGVCAACVVFTGWTLPWAQSRPDAAGILQIYDDLGANADVLYIADMSSLPSLFERLSVFESAPRGLYGNIFELGGWNSETPIKNAVLARYGIDTSPYIALIEREDVFLIDTAHFDTKAKYLRENYSKTACWSLYDNINGLFVYAVSDTRAYAPDADTAVLDFSMEPCEWSPSWTTYNFLVETDCAPTAAYIAFERAGETTMTYRARLLKIEDGRVYMTFAVPPIDMLDLGGRTARAVFTTQDGAVGCADAFSLTEEAQND